jgi:Phosphatidylglycerophosphatase A and related proteins
MSWRRAYPWLDAIPQKFCANISTLFFLGSLKAPGTWGSAAGALFAFFAMRGLHCAPYIIATLALIYLAIGICDIGEKFFNQTDPGKINFDEFVAMPICYIGIFCGSISHQSLWIWVLAGFILFRFFDILKPLGIKKIQNLSGGLGCVMDDVVAALCVCVILNVAKLLIL